MKFKLEVIGFNIGSCALAQAAGANRIELCDNPGDGGTTPSYGFIRAARNLLNIDLYPIIRPRGGDFFYSAEEFAIMGTDIQLCKDLGCDGVVIGMLKQDGRVDKQKCSQLVEMAYPMGVTFHRAFDRTIDPYAALEDIIDIGCERILTSGQKPNVVEGTELLAALISKAADRIIIMPGSGLRSSSVTMIAEKTGATEFHTSARTLRQSDMQFINPAMSENLEAVSLDVEEIKKIREALQHI